MAVRPMVRVAALLCTGLVASIMLAAPALAGMAVTAATTLPTELAGSRPLSKLDRAGAARLPAHAALKRDAARAPGSGPAPVSAEQTRARLILSRLIAEHPVLARHDKWTRATVDLGATPDDYQAIAFYKSGHIVISPDHTASLETLLEHEIWHVIDFRDNGRIDWGESVPPA